MSKLIEELEDGAAALLVLALQERQSGGSPIVVESRNSRAAQLRKRIEHIKQQQATIETQAEEELYYSLTEDLS